MYNQFSELEIIKTFFVYRSINFEMECVAQMDCFSDEAACSGSLYFLQSIPSVGGGFMVDSNSSIRKKF